MLGKERLHEHGIQIYENLHQIQRGIERHVLELTNISALWENHGCWPLDYDNIIVHVYKF